MLSTDGYSTKDKLKQGCLTFIKGVLGILLVGFLLNWGISQSRKKDEKYPWHGSVWYVYENSTSEFADKQFESLEKCREWALKQGDSKDLKEGKWDYSCGFKCKFTDQTINGGRKINILECEELTK